MVSSVSQRGGDFWVGGLCGSSVEINTLKKTAFKVARVVGIGAHLLFWAQGAVAAPGLKILAYGSSFFVHGVKAVTSLRSMCNREGGLIIYC